MIEFYNFLSKYMYIDITLALIWHKTYVKQMSKIVSFPYYTGWSKKRKPSFGGHFEILPGGNHFFCVHIWKI